MRLELRDRGAVDPSYAGHPVLARGDLECVEPPELGRVDGHDELAALVVRQRPVLAVLAQHRATSGAQLGLEAARSVVDPRVHDPGVVAGLVRGQPVLLLEDHDLDVWEPTGDLPAHRKAHDAASHDADRADGQGDGSVGGQPERPLGVGAGDRRDGVLHGPVGAEP